MDKITSIRPPKAEKRQEYAKLLATFEKYRGLPLFYPYIGSGVGNGALVELLDGSVKYDLISGIGVHFGHNHPTMIAAAQKGALEDIAMQGHLQQNLISFELTERLVKHSGLDHAFLTTSGAMANENALKIVLQKNTPAERILAFEGCFMGRTLTLSQITDKAAAREGLPSTVHVDYIPFYDWKEPEKSTKKAVHQLETYLKRYPGKYACMCFELIQGEAGAYPGTREFFVALMEVLKSHNVAIFVDEVQSFGRTDHLFAFQHFGLQEYVDVVTVGKLLHTCATLYTKEYCPKPGLITQTFTAATSSLHVGKAVIDSLVNEGFLGKNGRIMQLRTHFVALLEGIALRHPDIFEGPFGHGLMIAATPFKGEKEKVVHYTKALFDAGVITFMAGQEPTRVRFLIPAGGITTEALDEVAHILEEVLLACR